jgi:hypothetical protein
VREKKLIRICFRKSKQPHGAQGYQFEKNSLLSISILIIRHSRRKVVNKDALGKKFMIEKVEISKKLKTGILNFVYRKLLLDFYILINFF